MWKGKAAITEVFDNQLVYSLVKVKHSFENDPKYWSMDEVIVRIEWKRISKPGGEEGIQGVFISKEGEGAYGVGRKLCGRHRK